MDIKFYYNIDPIALYVGQENPIFKLTFIDFPALYLDSLKQSNQIYVLDIIKQNREIVFSIESTDINSYQGNFKVTKKIKNMTLYYQLRQFTLNGVDNTFYPISNNYLNVLSSTNRFDVNVSIELYKDNNLVKNPIINVEYDIVLEFLDTSSVYDFNGSAQFANSVLDLQGQNGSKIHYQDNKKYEIIEMPKVYCKNKIKFTNADKYQLSGNMYFENSLDICSSLEATLVFNFGTTIINVINKITNPLTIPIPLPYCLGGTALPEFVDCYFYLFQDGKRVKTPVINQYYDAVININYPLMPVEIFMSTKLNFSNGKTNFSYESQTAFNDIPYTWNTGKIIIKESGYYDISGEIQYFYYFMGTPYPKHAITYCNFMGNKTHIVSNDAIQTRVGVITFPEYLPIGTGIYSFKHVITNYFNMPNFLKPYLLGTAKDSPKWYFELNDENNNVIYVVQINNVLDEQKTLITIPTDALGKTYNYRLFNSDIFTYDEQKYQFYCNDYTSVLITDQIIDIPFNCNVTPNIHYVDNNLKNISFSFDINQIDSNLQQFLSSSDVIFFLDILNDNGEIFKTIEFSDITKSKDVNIEIPSNLVNKTLSYQFRPSTNFYTENLDKYHYIYYRFIPKTNSTLKIEKNKNIFIVCTVSPNEGRISYPYNQTTLISFDINQIDTKLQKFLSDPSIKYKVEIVYQNSIVISSTEITNILESFKMYIDLPIEYNGKTAYYKVSPSTPFMYDGIGYVFFPISTGPYKMIL